MTTEIRELLREVAPEPRQPLDVPALFQACRRRRRRARVRLAVLVAVLVLIPASVVIGLINGSGGHERIQVTGGERALQEPGATLSVPAGWQELPRLSAGDPREILVVGTAPRATSGESGSGAALVPIEACGPGVAPSGSAVFVTVYAYAATDGSTQLVPSPTHDGTIQLVGPKARPDPFTSTNSLVGADCATPSQSAAASTTDTLIPATTPSSAPASTAPTSTSTTNSLPTPSSVPTSPANHWREYVFTDAGRIFAARVVSVGDPSAQLLAAGLAVLNTVQLDASGLSGQPSTTTTTTGIRPRDPAAARQAIQDAFNSAFDNRGPVSQADSVEGGFPIGAAAQQAGRNANPSYVGSIVVRINWLQFIDATHATVNFDLLVNDQVITANTTGDVLVENGQWKVGRATYCEIVQRGGTIKCAS